MGFIIGLASYFVFGSIAALLNMFIDKLNLEEKINDFDKKNSGPVYNFLKDSLFIIFIPVGFLMFVCAIFGPIYFINILKSGNVAKTILAFIIISVSMLLVIKFTEND